MPRKPPPAAQALPPKLVTLDTPIGPIVLDRAGTRRTAYLTYRGEEYLFPEPYNSEPELPVGRFLNGISGAVVRALASKASFVWHANDNLQFTTAIIGEHVRIKRDRNVDRWFEQLAQALQAEVDPEALLGAFAELTSDLHEDIIWRPGQTRLHTHATREDERRAYLGRLAPLGGISLATVLPEMGYVEARTLPSADLPEDYVGMESVSYLHWRRNSYGSSSVWVRPAYRAASSLVEALAVEAGIPAVESADATLPPLELTYDRLDSVDREFGLAFVEGLRLGSLGSTIAVVSDVLELGGASIRKELPSSLLSDLQRVEELEQTRLDNLIPRGRADIVTLIAEDDTLLRIIASKVEGDPNHPLSPERFASLPDPQSVRADRTGYVSHRYGARPLPSYLHPMFDEEDYATAVAHYLQRDVPATPQHPLIGRAADYARRAREELLPLLNQMVDAGAVAIRQTRDALVLAADLLSTMQPEDLIRTTSRVDERRVVAPGILIAGELSWHPVPEQDGWEAVVLFFALNRAGEAVPVPGPLVSDLLSRPEPVALPISWEWRLGVVRFVAVAVARSRFGSVHVLGTPIRVAGLDAQRGRRVAVLIEDREWTGILDGITSRLGVAAGDRGRAVRHLQGLAELIETLPGRQDPSIFEHYSDEWLPSDLSNRTRVFILERAPVVDIGAEQKRFDDIAPRMSAALRRWPNLHRMLGGEFFLGAIEVSWYGDFHQTAVLSVPEDSLREADRILDLEITATNVLPLHAVQLSGGSNGHGTEAMRAAWLREADQALYLEHGVFEVSKGVIVRILGTAAPVAAARSEQVDRNYGRPRTVLQPGHLPRVLGEAPSGLEEIMCRSLPISEDRGELVEKLGLRSATILEAYREAGTYSGAARVLASWGAKVSANSLGAYIRDIRKAEPDLYASILGE